MVELLDDKEQKISRPRQWYTGQDVRSYTELQKR
jgi:citrate synthase